ncbi:MAG TPA: dihydrodipicolinate synthase family protein [Phycisphaeraceae bacterium]
MSQPICFITAIGTPLDEQDHLHEPGLEAHLDDVWQAGMHGILVAGTMGLFQMQLDETYQQLVQRSVELSAGRGQVLVGVGDTSLPRTLARIEWVNRFDVDGVVALTPYFYPFKPAELIDYYRALADASRAPLYLYDLPQLVGWPVPLEVVLEVAKHPNVRGIKCSGPPEYARQIVDQVDRSFRVVIAQPMMVDTFLRGGFTEHLDGVYGLAPRWTLGIAEAVQAGDWELARSRQQRLSELTRLLRSTGVLPAFSALMNARGIPGRFFVKPVRPLGEAERNSFLQQPIVQRLLQEDVPSRTAAVAS